MDYEEIRRAAHRGLHGDNGHREQARPEEELHPDGHGDSWDRDLTADDLREPSGPQCNGQGHSAPQDGAGRQTVPKSPGGKRRYRPLPMYRPFPLHALPPVLCDLVPASAEAIGCDPGLVTLPALAVAAGCIGNSRAIVVKKNWIEPIVTWSLTVAESGGHKSPAYNAAVGPLLEIQLDLFDQYHERVRDHKKERESWASLSAKERKATPGLVKPPAPEEPPVHVTSDATIEALGELLRDNPHSMLLARDELDAWFQSFTRYKGKGGGTDRPQWLDLHKAGTLILHRLTREQKQLAVRRAAVSVTGTIQPSILAGALNLDALQAGLGARFLLAMPPRRRRVWTEAKSPDQLADAYRQLLLNLLGLPLADVAKRKPYYLGLSVAKCLKCLKSEAKRVAAMQGEAEPKCLTAAATPARDESKARLPSERASETAPCSTPSPYRTGSPPD
jgi:hypothetical protein